MGAANAVRGLLEPVATRWLLRYWWMSARAYLVNSVLLRSTILVGSTVCTKIITSGRKPKAQTHPPAVNGTGTTLILLTRLVIFLASLVCRCSRARLA